MEGVEDEVKVTEKLLGIYSTIKFCSTITEQKLKTCYDNLKYRNAGKYEFKCGLFESLNSAEIISNKLYKILLLIRSCESNE